MEQDNRDNKYFDLDSVNPMGTQMERTTSTKKGSFVGGVIVGMTIALLIVCAVFLGTRLQQYIELRNNPTAALAKQLEFAEDSAISPILVNKLQNLEATVKEKFYLNEVSEEEFAEGIYSGLMMALEDPYSEYYTAEELNEIMSQTEGIYYGIGAYVSMDELTNLPKVSGVIEGAPAEAAQLRANDIIYEVDGESTYGLSLNEVVAMIKGEEGTEVVLTLIRDGENDYLEVPVTRAKVESPTVNFEMLDETMAYIQIVEFDDVTVDQFAEALAMAKGSGMEGLILDLRANPGGSLNAVVDIAQMLLPKGLVVYTEDKQGKRVEYACDGKREFQLPMVVLVDMNSASAAEILAGAIQDYGIGTLVGTTTFGKGIVQQIVPFTDGSAIKLTISSYFTPNGRNIHEVGIEPDVICEFDGEAYYNSENPVDNQLEKAKEILKGLQ